MNKRITTALLASGLMLGGIGTAQMAFAQDAEPEPSPGVEVQDETEDQVRPDREPGERRRGCGHGLETAAETIGIDVEDLRTALDEGQSIAEVAEANGVDPQEVIDAMVAESTERLDAKVDEGRLTAEEADERLAEKSERIEDRVFGVDTEADVPAVAA
jgi:hypothetical protein